MNQVLFVVFLLVLALLPAPALAFGVGDGIALVVFLALGVVILCAVLGFISRRLNRS